jgi:hypothetical protein
MKQTGLFLVLASVFIFSSCGADSAPTLTSATVGPTSPGGYFFEMTVSPSVVDEGGSTVFTVRVWDSNGNPASGVAVYFSGSVDEAGPGTTGSAGITLLLLDVKEGTGTFSMTATIESESVTVSYMVV